MPRSPIRQLCVCVCVWWSLTESTDNFLSLQAGWVPLWRHLQRLRPAGEEVEETTSWIQEKLESRTSKLSKLFIIIFLISSVIVIVMMTSICELLGGWRQRRFQHEGNTKRQEDEEATEAALGEEQEQQ